MIKYVYFLFNKMLNGIYRYIYILSNKPQRQSIVYFIRIKTPRKPNSARRKIVKSTDRGLIIIFAYIPGGDHSLRKYSLVLIRGGGARDLPGVYTSCIRGRYDLLGLINRKNRRSIYGAKRKLV